MAAGANMAVANLDRRDAPRDEVSYRTRATLGSGETISIHIVNVSANGFMARTERSFEPGAPLTVRLPVVGLAAAEVRWSLGGRIGCQFGRMIDLAPYLELLGELVRNAR
jgi:hypothetical protein